MAIVKYLKGDKINLDSLVSSINKRSNADFVKRLKLRNRLHIKDWASNNIATHKLSWATDDNGAIVFPSVQRIDGKLYDFTDPKNNRGKWDALDTAIERGDTLRMTPSEADLFTRNYKKYYPKFQTGGTVQDNTRVSRPIIMLGVPYKLKPNEFYFVDKKTGKKTLIKRKLEIVTEDKRSNYLRLLDLNKTKQILKLLEQDKNYEKGIETIDALTKLALPSTYIGPLFNNNGKSYTDNLISGEGTGSAAGNAVIDGLTPFATGSAIKGGSYIYNTGNRLYNNWLDLRDLRNFMSRYLYNLINPKNSIIFNDSKLDRLFNHIVESHNTFTRGVDPYEAIKFGRFPEGSNIEEVARYSLTHIPSPTATNDAGLLPGEAALYTSNSIGLSLRYTNGNGYIGILRRPIKYGFKTRRDFLHGNDFRFNPIPNNALSITTDFPKNFKQWTRKQSRLDSKNPRKYLGRTPRYTLTPLNSFQVRANSGAFPRKNTNRTDDHFRHYLFIGNPGELPLLLIRMYPYKGSKGISDYDYTSVGLSHKK